MALLEHMTADCYSWSRAVGGGGASSTPRRARLNIATRSTGKESTTLTRLEAARLGTQIGQVHVCLATIDVGVRVFASPLSGCTVGHGHLEAHRGIRGFPGRWGKQTVGSRAQAPPAFTSPDPRCPLPKASAQPPSSLGPLTPKLPLDPSSSLRVQLLRNAALQGQKQSPGTTANPKERRGPGVAYPARGDHQFPHGRGLGTP